MGTQLPYTLSLSFLVYRVKIPLNHPSFPSQVHLISCLIIDCVNTILAIILHIYGSFIYRRNRIHNEAQAGLRNWPNVLHH